MNVSDDPHLHDYEDEPDDPEPPRCSMCKKMLPMDKEGVLWESTRVSLVRLDFDGGVEDVDDVDADYCEKCWDEISALIKKLKTDKGYMQ